MNGDRVYSRAADAGGGLRARLEQLAMAPVLLVSCDYDGTLSHLVDNPSRATPVRAAMVSLRALSEMSGTHVAVISGRSLTDLERLSGAPPGMRLVGSHGSEFAPGFSSTLSGEQRGLLKLLHDDLVDISATAMGLLVEAKPAAIALHY
ncbi:MAG: trehalose-phosphatase, partial [Phycisphaerales bacterium]|nr:trehalose-phosphatase [Phycisphaerales bacterium]